MCGKWCIVRAKGSIKGNTEVWVWITRWKEKKQWGDWKEKYLWWIIKTVVIGHIKFEVPIGCPIVKKKLNIWSEDQRRDLRKRYLYGKYIYIYISLKWYEWLSSSKENEKWGMNRAQSQYLRNPKSLLMRRGRINKVNGEDTRRCRGLCSQEPQEKSLQQVWSINSKKN